MGYPNPGVSILPVIVHLFVYHFQSMSQWISCRIGLVSGMLFWRDDFREFNFVKLQSVSEDSPTEGMGLTLDMLNNTYISVSLRLLNLA